LVNAGIKSIKSKLCKRKLPEKNLYNGTMLPKIENSRTG